MRAIVIHSAGDLRIDEVPEDRPGDDEVLVELAAGGVCGSDLHYYNHGGFGPISLKEPMILGHEVAGRIVGTGNDVSTLKVGDLVAVSPSRPCRTCGYCLKGQPNHCMNMRFYGSAMPFPHIQGAFRERLVALESQCVVAEGLSAGEAAMAEPLAVVLHACRRAGELLGKTVLVTGAGPIGVLCVLAARRAGAARIIATDLEDFPLSFATACGANQTINVRQDGDALNAFAADKGQVDVLFECSGAEIALRNAIPLMKPRGVIMQLGLGGDMSLPMMQITAKELDLRGSFRFHEEFALAVQLMQQGLIDVKPLISHTVGLDDAVQGFAMANDRTQAMKVQIGF